MMVSVPLGLAYVAYVPLLFEIGEDIRVLAWPPLHLISSHGLKVAWLLDLHPFIVQSLFVNLIVPFDTVLALRSVFINQQLVKQRLGGISTLN